MSTIAIAAFLVLLAGFAGVLLNPRNTLALVDPLFHWLRPSASSADVNRVHTAARDLGHFLIPAVAFAVLVAGPLRRRPGAALILCISFGVIDESLQSVIPGREGSLTDVMTDASGAIFSYLLYRATTILLRTVRVSAARARN